MQATDLENRTTKNIFRAMAMETRLRVEGMMCQQSCGTTVAAALRRVPGVVSAEVSYPKKEARIAGTPNVQALIDAVEAVGFDATVKTILRIEGMMCQQSCGTTVRQALLGVPGVVDAEVSYPRARAEIYGIVTRKALIDAVEGVGFDADEITEDATDHVALEILDDEVVEKTEVVMLKSPLTKKEVDDIKRIVGSKEGVSRVDVNALAGRFIVSHAKEVDIRTACRGLDCRFDDDDDDDDGPLYLAVEGMSCAACSSKVEKSLKKLNFVRDAAVSSTTHRAKVVPMKTPLTEDQITELVAAVTKLGFKATPPEDETFDDDAVNAAAKRDVASWQKTFLVAAILVAPMLIVKWSLAGSPWWTAGIVCRERLSRYEIFEAAFGYAVQLTVGMRFFRAALKGIQVGNYGMDLLVTVATTIISAYSTLSLVDCCSYSGHHDHAMFDTAAMLLFFVALGKFLEANAKHRASGAIAALLRMQPKHALLLQGHRIPFIRGECPELTDTDEATIRDLLSEFTVVPSNELKPGDIVIVEPGAAVPTDGVVATSLSATRDVFVDESAMTGEARPAAKKRGDPVFGASGNRSSTFACVVTQTGAKSAIAQIAKIVRDAQLAKAPVQEYADAVASRFTPVILSVALLVFLSWYAAGLLGGVPSSWLDQGDDRFLFALLFGVSVVVVACPCALGLATPTAVMCGTAVGASFGILVKGGDVLETATHVKTVIFDKTGTLTRGHPQVTDVRLIDAKVQTPKKSFLVSNKSNTVVTGGFVSSPVGGKAPGDFDDDAKRQARLEADLAILAAVETQSEHPIAKAIVACAKERGLSLEQVTESDIVPGRGVFGTLGGGRKVAVGSLAMIRELVNDVEVFRTLGIDAAVDALRVEAKTVVLGASLEDTKWTPFVLVAVADAPRPEAARTIALLKSPYFDVDVKMLTGDDPRTAVAVAKQVGLGPEDVRAGVLPAGKADFVRELQGKHRCKVAMIGDGINDSPALAVADVGVAVGGGTQVAMEAADVVLVKSDLRDVLVALDLAKRVYKRIKLNFIWATCYNVVLVPVAAGALYPTMQSRLPPATAALCMAFSSVSVVCSSLALKFYRPPRTFYGGKQQRHRDDDLSRVVSIDDLDDLFDDDALIPDKKKVTVLKRCRLKCRQFIFATTGRQFYSRCIDRDSPSGRSPRPNDDIEIPTVSPLRHFDQSPTSSTSSSSSSSATTSTMFRTASAPPAMFGLRASNGKDIV